MIDQIQMHGEVFLSKRRLISNFGDGCTHGALSIEQAQPIYFLNIPMVITRAGLSHKLAQPMLKSLLIET